MNQRPEPSNFAAEASQPAPERADGLTPAGLQSRALMTRRRLTVLVLNVTTFVALMWGLSIVLAAGGWTVIDVVIFVAFAFDARAVEGSLFYGSVHVEAPRDWARRASAGIR
jgi:membrane glycosyltransferase